MFAKYLRPFFALTVIMLISCSTPHYKIILRDGREFNTASKPEFSPKTGYYRFRALSGKDSLIRADEILMMNEQ